MPEIDVPNDGEAHVLVDRTQAEEAESFHVRVTQDDCRITQVSDRRYAEKGNVYPQGASTWVSVEPGNALFAINAGSTDAVIEMDQQPAPAAVTQDPSASGTRTVTDDGSFNLAGNQDVDVAEASIGSVPVEQQTPVALEDAAGALIDPSEQQAYAVEYTDVDLNTLATTTIYAPANDSKVSGVHMQNSGGTAVVRLEVTNGTDTAVLAGEALSAGDSVHFEDEVKMAGGADELQIVVSTAEGAALVETAAVSRGEI